MKRENDTNNHRPLEQLWSDTRVFDRLDVGREIHRPATVNLVTRILNQHVKTTGKTIEIGSGLGELVYNLLPSGAPFRKSIQQTEQSGPTITRHKSMHPDSNISQINVYSLGLHYEPDSVDTIIGFSSFDTFADPSRAVQAMDFVLKPGGKVVHFLDARACINTFFFTRDPKVDSRIPFPTVEKSPDHLVLIPRGDVEKTIELIQGQQHGDTLAEQLAAYLDNPEESYAREENFGTLEKFANKIASTIDTAEAQTINLNHFFYNRIKTALEERGMQLEVFGLEEGISLQTNPESQRMSLPYAIVSEVGEPTFEYDPKIRDDQTKTVSRLHVIVAKKPE